MHLLSARKKPGAQMQSEGEVWLVATVVVLNGQMWQPCGSERGGPVKLSYEPSGHGMQLSRELAPRAALKKPGGHG